ncbi:hypothetical protein EDB81DRAFT_883193 [Dactylonectria macrodidyma]|uniref:F-box domain-containing protein n=1 Tax=Dactylonectria macrodidyma TaxID=307937 RepID=A0A9P9J3R5_9HYPO|nr:hypothetical protein EDB81DRAFT_883193 [Dactylonectria macrodidyma]
MSSQTPKSAESTIQEARRHYAEKRFKPALEQFTRAMKLCPCARGIKRERCTCKNFEKVALEGGSIFNEAMYTCKCSVGKTFNKCDNALHIQALDYRAATFEALQELGRAQRDAEWILELAPRLLEGYLRLGKIARLQKKYEFAWKVYNTGIEVGTTHGLAANPKMQTLYTLRQPLHRRFSRQDPLKNPQEIVQRIFHFIDFATLVRCLRVSKSWRQYVTSRGNERLWRAVIFQKEFPHRFAPSTAAVKALLSYSGNDAREVVISSVQRFRLNQHKFNAILQASRNLERLTMRDSIVEQVQIPARPRLFTKLAHVHLEDFLISQPNFLRMLVAHCADTLQSLYLSSLPAVGSRTDLELPALPLLKHLRLEEHDSPYPLRLEIFSLAAKAPHVQQLRLHDIRLGYDKHHDDSSADIDHLWKDLKSFTLGVEDITVWDSETADIIQKLTALRHGADFQHIDFDFHWKYNELGPLARGGLRRMFNQQPTPLTIDGVDMYNQYDDLRSLRLTHAVINSAVLERSVGTAVQAGKLHTLDLVFPLERHGSAEGVTSMEYLREHEWLRGAASIRHIGVFNFRFRSHPRDDEDLPLPAFLASFPNLETLEIKSQHYDMTEFYTILQAILKVTKLRTLYQTAMQGVLLDLLTVLTEKAGVELVSGTRPQEWPVPIEN